MDIFREILSGKAKSPEAEEKERQAFGEAYRGFFFGTLEPELRDPEKGVALRSELLGRIERLLNETEAALEAGAEENAFRFYVDLRQSLQFSKAFLENFPVGQPRQMPILVDPEASSRPT